MSCSLQSLKGTAPICGGNIGGIKKVFIALYENVESVAADLSAHTITGITMSGTTKFATYNITKQSSSLSSPMTKDEANGVLYYTNTLTLNFNKMEAAKHLELEALASQELAIIVLDNNGKYFYLAYDTYASASAAQSQSGQNYGDQNGYSLTIDQMSAYQPFEVSKTIVEGVVEEGTL